MIAIVANDWGTTVQNLFDKKLPIGPVFLSNLSQINYNNVTVTNDQTLIFDRCRQLDVKFVALAGFKKKLTIPEDFTNRVVNIHPSLLPAFGGKGMYGIKVHEAVVKAGVRVTGCTVHFVNNEYDAGQIIAQNPVPVFHGDSPEQVQERVKREERKLYPAILYLLLNNRIINGQMVDAKELEFKDIWGY